MTSTARKHRDMDAEGSLSTSFLSYLEHYPTECSHWHLDCLSDPMTYIEKLSQAHTKVYFHGGFRTHKTVIQGQ